MRVKEINLIEELEPFREVITAPLKLYPEGTEGVEYINIGAGENTKASQFLNIDSGMFNVKTSIGRIRSIKNLITYCGYDIPHSCYESKDTLYVNKKYPIRPRSLNREAIVLYAVLSWVKSSKEAREILMSDEVGDLPLTYITSRKIYDPCLEETIVSRRLVVSRTYYYVKALEIARVLLKNDIFTGEIIKKIIDANVPEGDELFRGFELKS